MKESITEEETRIVMKDVGSHRRVTYCVQVWTFGLEMRRVQSLEVGLWRD